MGNKGHDRHNELFSIAVNMGPGLQWIRANIRVRLSWKVWATGGLMGPDEISPQAYAIAVYRETQGAARFVWRS